MPELTPKRSIARTESSLPKIPQLKIATPPTSAVTAIAQSELGLLCGYGEVGEQEVLVPYLQMRLLRFTDEAGDVVEENTEAFHAALAYDNVAFLVLDLVRDLRAMTARLQTFASGKLKPEPVRLMHSKRFLQRAKDQIDATLEQLDKIIADCPPVVAEKPVRKVRVKPSVEAVQRPRT